jgi:hypothetical protein
MALLWLSVSSAFAAPVAEAWAGNSAAVSRASPVPVGLRESDLPTLLAGGTVARRTETEQGIYATGAVLVDTSIEAAWITIQDAIDDPESRVRVEWVTGAPPGVRRVYNVLPLPFPLADRQWVMDLTNNRALFDATGGAVWQRTWREVDPQLAPSPSPTAEWLPTNRGAWTLLPTDDGVLVLFSVRTVFGGMIPAGLSNSWAVSTLHSSLKHLEARAKAMPAHYAPDHEPVLTPAGARIGPLAR